MSRIFSFRRAAVKEVADAYIWYEEQRPGLGREFIVELEAAYKRIEQNPELPRVFYRQARKVHLRRFPFFVIYVVTPEQIRILSVFHGSRNPIILRRRLK